MQEADLIEEYLQKTGVEQAAGKIYVALLQEQRPTVLHIAKTLGISRSQIYQHLKILQSNGLVSTEQLEHGVLYRALPLENIDHLISERERETKQLREQFDTVTQAARTLMHTHNTIPAVKHYYGLTGLKQANWNLTKAQSEYRVFETAHLPEHFDKAFAYRCNQRFFDRRIESYDLTNAKHAIASQLQPFHPELLHYRHIDPAIFNIAFEVYLYDGIITLLDYSPQSMHAVEIQNPALYIMMRQIFETMWGLGRPINVTNL